jgi:hypothetical protein
LYRTGPAAALLCLALGLASCGGGGTSSVPAAAPTAAATTGGVTTSPASGGVTTSPASGGAIVEPGPAGGKPTAAAGAKPHRAAACEAQLGDFVDRMDDLRQALLAGLSYSEYVVRVRAIEDAYEAVPVKKLGVDCVAGPAASAEDAFNDYLKAANVWGECAGTAGCAASEIEGKLQHRWHVASKSLDAAKRD